MIAPIEDLTRGPNAGAQDTRDGFTISLGSLESVRRQMLRETEAFLGRRLKRDAGAGWRIDHAGHEVWPC